MDYSPIIAQVWTVVLWLLPLVVLAAILKSPGVKGLLGERFVRRRLRRRLDPARYHSLHDLTLATPDGTTQIDHVVVSPFGIFVLETKNMQGWIFGDPNQARWTQTIYRRRVRFQNPLRQNHKHVKALQAALAVPPETIHSVVAFVGTATFKTPMPANVTAGGGFIDYIRSFRTPVLTEEDIREVLQRLQAKRLTPSTAARRAHVQQLARRADPQAERRCPKCGSPLVLRTAKTGAKAGERFWGCSTFPKCRVRQPLG
jgi:restriction system protein